MNKNCALLFGFELIPLVSAEFQFCVDSNDFVTVETQAPVITGFDAIYTGSHKVTASRPVDHVRVKYNGTKVNEFNLEWSGVEFPALTMHNFNIFDQLVMKHYRDWSLHERDDWLIFADWLDSSNDESGAEAVRQWVMLQQGERAMSEDACKAITPDWLRSIGFEQNRPCHIWGTPNTNWWNDNHRIEIWEFNDTGDYLWVGFDSIRMSKREHLQLLIEWVGFPGSR